MPTRRSVGFIATGTIAVVVVTFLAVIRWWAVPISIGVLTWFAAHGIWLARRLMSSDSTRAHWLFGPVWGMGLCVTGLLILWLAGGRGLWILVGAPWPIWLLLWLPLGRVGEGLRLPTYSRGDLVAVLLLFLIVPAVAGTPYAHVGEPTANGGKAYRAYFTADFVWAMTIVSEVSKGEIPPKNPFLAGGTLHYYWLSHFLSAVEYRALGLRGLTIEEITLANSLGYGLAFVAFLYGFGTRVRGQRPRGDCRLRPCLPGQQLRGA